MHNSIALTMNNLKNSCRICFSNGQINIWQAQKIVYEQRNTKIDANNTTTTTAAAPTIFLSSEVTTELICASEMLQEMCNNNRKNGEDNNTSCGIFDLSHEMELICHLCLSNLIKNYIFYKKVVNANQQMLIMYAATKENIQMEQREQEEQNLMEPATLINNAAEETLSEMQIQEMVKVEVQESRKEINTTTAEEQSASANVYIQIERPTKETTPKNKQFYNMKRKLKQPHIFLSAGVAHILTHLDSETLQNNDIDVIAPTKRKRVDLNINDNDFNNDNVNNVIDVDFFNVVYDEKQHEDVLQCDKETVTTHAKQQNLTNDLQHWLINNDDTTTAVATSNYSVETQPITNETANDDDALALDQRQTSSPTSTPTNVTNCSLTTTTSNLNMNSNEYYACKYCDNAFSIPDFLRTHVLKTHVCKYCPEISKTSNDLFKHMRKKHNKKNCNICMKYFNTPRNFLKHMKSIHKMKMENPLNLEDHMLISIDH